MDFNYLEEVSSGSFDWTVRVRVLRKWRGVSSSNGKEFKGFNILLVDSKVMIAMSLNNYTGVIVICLI